MPSTWVSEPPDADVPGYLSTVHHNALETNLWWGVPDKAAMANGFLAFMIFIGTWVGWRWLPVGALIHGLLALFTYGDSRRIEKYVRALRFQSSYAAGLRSAPSARRFARYYVSWPWVTQKPTKASMYVAHFVHREDDFTRAALQDPAVVQADGTLADLDRWLKTP